MLSHARTWKPNDSALIPPLTSQLKQVQSSFELFRLACFGGCHTKLGPCQSMIWRRSTSHATFRPASVNAGVCVTFSFSGSFALGRTLCYMPANRRVAKQHGNFQGPQFQVAHGFLSPPMSVQADSRTFLDENVYAQSNDWCKKQIGICRPTSSPAQLDDSQHAGHSHTHSYTHI